MNKKTLISCLCLLVAVVLLVDRFAQHRKITARTQLSSGAEKTIDDVVTELLDRYPDSKFGMEELPRLKYIICMPAAIETNESEAQALVRVCNLISKQTDYECHTFDHWLVALPRHNNSLFDKPLASRIAITPTVSGVTVKKYLGMIKAANQDDPVSLTQDLYFMRHKPNELIYSQESTIPCYRALSELTDQLSVRCWRLSHSFSIKSGTHDEIEYPLKLSMASVIFHAPGEVRAYKSTKEIRTGK